MNTKTAAKLKQFNGTDRLHILFQVVQDLLFILHDLEGFNDKIYPSQVAKVLYN